MKVLDYDDVSKCPAFETGDKIVLNGQIFKCVGGSEMKDYNEILDLDQGYVNVYIYDGKISMVYGYKVELEVSREQALKIASMLTEAAGVVEHADRD